MDGLGEDYLEALQKPNVLGEEGRGESGLPEKVGEGTHLEELEEGGGGGGGRRARGRKRERGRG